MQQLADSLLIRLQAVDQMIHESIHAIGEDPDAVEKVADNQRLEDVELELTIKTADSGRSVVSNDLSGYHG